MTTIPERFEVAAHRLGASGLRVGVVGGLATLICGWCLLPILTGGWWLSRATVVVACVVLAGALMRALRVPVPLLPIGSAAVMLAAVSALFVPGAATWRFLPGPGAISALRELLESGRADAWVTVPPADSTPGLLLIVVGGIGLVAVMVDTLAPSLDLPGLTILPLGALFCAPWLVGGDFPPTWSFVVLVLAWLMVISAHEINRIRTTLPGAAASPALPALAAVAATLAICVIAAPWAPASGDGRGVGAHSRPLGVSLEPVVSLRRALLHSTGMTVMTYETSAKDPDYLRLAVLDQFDGTEWKASPTSAAGRRLFRPNGRSEASDSYRISIGPLVGPVIPSPAGTVAANTSGPVSWTSAGLPVRASGSSVRDTDAEVQVREYGWSASALDAASQEPSQRPIGYDADPGFLVGPELGELARSVTASASSPYEQAVALQDWFTDSGGFKYSTQTPPGSSGSDLETFLSDRTGYCEQFAATMALMARSLGIPARVVVGFTQGRQAEGIWTVLDSDAHAWPELWLGAAGWMRFEPTPRQSSVVTPAYAAPSAQPEAEESAPVAEPTPKKSEAAEPTTTDAQDASQGSGTSGWQFAWVAVAALLLGLAATPGAVRFVRRRRRLGALNGPAGAQEAYAELLDTMVDLRLGQPGVTERATCGELLRAIGASGEVSAAGERIVALVERERYGRPDGPASGRSGVGAPVMVAARGEALRSDLGTARTAMSRRAGAGRRILGVLAPRSLWR